MNVSAEDLMTVVCQQMRAEGRDPTERPTPVRFAIGDVEFRVRQLGPVERCAAYRWAWSHGDAHPDRPLMLFALSFCDAEGEPLYDLADLEAVRHRHDAATIAAVAAWCVRASGW